MLGSMLSNMLLILGCGFLAGGIKYQEQHFSSAMASTMSSLMAVASASLIIPATIYDVFAKAGSSDRQSAILLLSYGTAVVLLVLYAMYLVFQLKTHSDLFDEERPLARDAPGHVKVLGPWAAGTALVIVTVLVAVCAQYLVKSINSFVGAAHFNKSFVGFILLPIVGNAAEHATAVIVARKNKMDLAIGVAFGSCLQIALFVTPSLVLLGWAMGRSLTLRFQTFETVVFFLSVLVVALLIQDGKSNYFEGVLCLGM